MMMKLILEPCGKTMDDFLIFLWFFFFKEGFGMRDYAFKYALHFGESS